MSADLFDELEGRIDSLVQVVNALRLENGRLQQENVRLNGERATFKNRIDSILKKLEEV